MSGAEHANDDDAERLRALIRDLPGATAADLELTSTQMVALAQLMVIGRCKHKHERELRQRSPSDPESMARLAAQVGQRLVGQARGGRIPSGLEAAATVLVHAASDIQSALHQARDLLKSDRIHHAQAMGSEREGVGGTVVFSARRARAAHSSAPAAGTEEQKDRDKLRRRRLDALQRHVNRLASEYGRALEAVRFVTPHRTGESAYTLHQHLVSAGATLNRDGDSPGEKRAGEEQALAWARRDDRVARLDAEKLLAVLYEFRLEPAANPTSEQGKLQRTSGTRTLTPKRRDRILSQLVASPANTGLAVAMKRAAEGRHLHFSGALPATSTVASSEPPSGDTLLPCTATSEKYSGSAEARSDSPSASMAPRPSRRSSG